ncbi:hypothetical protein QYS36_14020 [Pseudomonas sp. G34]|uniref:hypothetical protein n=1 Tax=Pseudomonas sp. G34 TaxID=3059083 RepID=UPI002808F7B1|nr:hypothetical protein [Pseudomonas sp. G34]MDQ7986054.1 hypothetical protein [Pseudomonas sp. G34]
MEKIILTDKLWQGFIGQAYSEKLLELPASEHDEVGKILNRYKVSKHKKEALTLFLLYDKTIISDDHLGISSPLLEAQNCINLCSERQVLDNIFAYSNWTDKRDPTAFAKALELVKDNIEFVVPWAAKQKFIMLDQVAKDFRLSKHQVITHFTDFGYQYFNSRELPLDHIFTKTVGEEIANIFCDGFKEASKNPEIFHNVDVTLFRLMVQAERFANAKTLSIEYKAPAAGTITSDGRYAFDSKTDPSNPSTLVSDFHVVRQAFTDASLSIPVPSSIKEAITLKSDPNFKPFQEQLTLFQRKFATGQVRDSEKIINEIRRARK